MSYPFLTGGAVTVPVRQQGCVTVYRFFDGRQMVG